MTQTVTNVATNMTRLVASGELMRKAVAIENRHEYDDTPFGKYLRQSSFIHHLAFLVPDTSGAAAAGDYKKKMYTKPRMEDFVYETDNCIANTLGQIVAPPPIGMMKTLISKGQNALEQSDGTFSTFSFKGWKVFVFSSTFDLE